MMQFCKRRCTLMPNFLFCQESAELSRVRLIMIMTKSGMRGLVAFGNIGDMICQISLTSATLWTNRPGCNKSIDERSAFNIKKVVLAGVSAYEVLCEWSKPCSPALATRKQYPPIKNQWSFVRTVTYIMSELRTPKHNKKRYLMSNYFDNYVIIIYNNLNRHFCIHVAASF